jgi:N-methylhydantoinase A
VRIAVDTGGTFTDLVVDDGDGALRLYKSPTTPEDPVRGILDVVAIAAADWGLGPEALLARTSTFVHATTRATNAILTGTTARTAFLTTLGHPDILLFREGGRTNPFDFTRPYPEPYVPRSLTFEVPERIGSAGQVIRPLDEAAVRGLIAEVERQRVEAVAVCLLWSIANPVHELRVAALLDRHLPGVPRTLSHSLNATLREYRRASSTAIDASLKPVMSRYLERLAERLRGLGFRGRVLVVTATGGLADAAAVAAAPIHAVGSGPAMAPVAGRRYARLEAAADTAIVADAGGTSYDVSLVRRGRIPWTRETWLGPRFQGHMTGFPSVDVRSIGAGGGSIAWVDDGGLLHVGPESAAAVPGPACYGRGGSRATVTDAALVLGYLDPHCFLGGAIALDVEAARRALHDGVGRHLGLGPQESAAAVLELTTEHMVHAIEDITLNQGIDPRSAVLVGGGGSAGLNVVAIARRLGVPRVLVPDVAAALSAAGALLADLTAEYGRVLSTTSARFDFDAVNKALAELVALCRSFAEGAGESTIELSAEARYPHQVWELEVPLRVMRFHGSADVEQLRQDFHALHEDVFAIADPDSPVELVAWRARVRCGLERAEATLVDVGPPLQLDVSRRVHFPHIGTVEATVHSFGALTPGEVVEGPAIVESPVTTVVIDPGASAVRTAMGNLSILPRTAAAARAAMEGETRVASLD